MTDNMAQTVSAGSSAFPPSVAALLLEALAAGSNHVEAVKYYEDARQEALRVGLELLSEQYIEISLKAAHCRAAQGDALGALAIYEDLANKFYAVLEENQVVEDTKQIIIKAALRVVLLMGPHTQRDMDEARRVMLPFILKAQSAAASQSKELAELLRAGPSYIEVLDGTRGKLAFSSTLEGTWGLFRQELFALREMYASLAIETADYSKAGLFKQQTTELMMLSGFSHGEVLLSVFNVGTLTYSIAQLDNDDDEALTLAKDKEFHMARAQNIFATVTSTIEKQSEDVRKEEKVRIAYALSIYGLATVYANRQDWDKSWIRAHEAQTLAKNLPIDSLLNSDATNAEISKLELLRDSTGSTAGLRFEELPKLPVISWKMTPTDWTLPIETPHIDALEAARSQL